MTPDPNSIRSILVLRLRAFGDTLLTTPTLRGLKRAYPAAKLSVVMEPAMAQVLKGLPYVDEVIPFDRLAAKRRGPLGELKATLEFWRLLRRRRFDLAMDVLGSPRTAAMCLASGAPTRVGFAFRFRRLAYNVVHRPAAQPKYIADYTADALRALGHQPDSLELDFCVSPRAQAEADAWLAGQGLLAPAPAPLLVQAAGGWESKRYPLELLARALGLALRGSRRRALLLWGPGERPQAEELASLCGEAVRLAPPTDFEGMGALLKRGAALLTNDNASKHLAVACGCPSLTLFGPTDERAWHPPGQPRHRALALDLDCRPCSALRCPLGTQACLRDLEPARVAAELRELMESA